MLRHNKWSLNIYAKKFITLEFIEELFFISVYILMLREVVHQYLIFSHSN